MWVGDVLDDRFVIERPIGQGGMGSVFLGTDRQTHGRVAVKCLDLQGVEVENRFSREARVLEQVAHPNVVRHVAAGRTAGGEAYLVMEWLEGEDLSQRLARGPLAFEDAIAVVRIAAEGIGAAHARGIVHRDLKPSNLFLIGGDPCQVKVLDFGIARVTTTGSALTRTGAFLGTIGYMAPEQARDPKHADARADVFSLGCILYECLTGQPPYAGATPVAVLSKVLCEQPVPPRTMRPGIPRELDEFTLSMLAKDPGNRVPDADTVAQRLGDMGAALAAEARASTLVVEPPALPLAPERRTVSVLYVKGARFTEDLVAPFRGKATRIGDDMWLVLFEGREAAGDRARQAAACAIALRDAGAERIALATGLTETAPGSPIGPAIDRAATLLVAADRFSPGTVLIDDVTASLVEGSFGVEQRGEHRVVVGARPDAGAGRLLMGRPTPLVGRERDLAVLETMLAECLEEPVARVAVVTAQPGGGKSRLRRELLDRVAHAEDLTVLLGSGAVTGTTSPLTLARQLLRSAVGAPFDATAEVLAEAIQARLASMVAPARQRPLGDFLAVLLGIELPGKCSGPLRAAWGDPRAMAELLSRALDEWLAAELAHRPVLIVIDDMQWVDTATVDLLVRALKTASEKHFLVLAFARPEVRDVFPGLWSLSPTVLPLPRLGPRAAERFVRLVLGPHAKDEAVARAVTLADGNAFFLEELARAISEGHLHALPESVLAMAEARLDALKPDARRLLRSLSVAGEPFSWDLAHAVAATGMVTASRLDALADDELLERSTSRDDPGLRYSFRHALLREAAYAQLTSEERTRLHARIAEYLERGGAHSAADISRHWEEAGEPVRALPWLATASSDALFAGDTELAAMLARKGISMGATGQCRGLLRMGLAVHLLTLAPDEAFENATGACDDLEEGTDHWFTAAAAGFLASATSARPEEGALLLRRILGVMETPFAVGPGSGTAIWFCTSMLLQLGQISIAEGLLQRARARGAEGQNSAPLYELNCLGAETVFRLYGADSCAGLLTKGRAAAALSNEIASGAFISGIALGNALLYAGSPAEAESHLRSQLSRTGPASAANLRLLLGVSLDYQGKHEEAQDVLRPFSEYQGALGAFASLLLAMALARAGALDDAERTALAVTDRVAHVSSLALFQRRALAHVALARDNAASALELASEGLQIGLTVWRAPTVQLELRLAKAKALHALGRFAEARDAIRDAEERVHAARDSIEEPELREKYVEAYSWTREIVALAREWLGGS